MSDDRRRVPCGPARFVAEGAILSVPIIPAFWIEDDAIGTVKVRGALIARRLGALYAYANVCRHIPLTLDLGDGEVAARDGRHFLCHHHGARYRIEDGGCASGPCDGDSLVKLEIEAESLRSGDLVLILPPAPAARARVPEEPGA